LMPRNLGPTTSPARSQCISVPVGAHEHVMRPADHAEASSREAHIESGRGKMIPCGTSMHNITPPSYTLRRASSASIREEFFSKRGRACKMRVIAILMLATGASAFLSQPALLPTPAARLRTSARNGGATQLRAVDIPAGCNFDIHVSGVVVSFCLCFPRYCSSFCVGLCNARVAPLFLHISLFRCGLQTAVFWIHVYISYNTISPLLSGLPA